jgi:murein DD-endopeptidase MepM/ murein hydrolase activator NlpD
MRRLLVLAVLIGLVALLVTRAEPLAPTVSLEAPVDVIGSATPLRVHAADRGSGLAAVEVRLVPPAGAPVIVLEQTFPRTSWLGSGVHAADLAGTIDAGAARLPEGPATLEVWVADHSWASLVRQGRRLSRPVTVDVTPPTVEVESEERVARLGGAETVVFRVGADAVESGVQVGNYYFPATAGLFTDPAARAALFALPQDSPGARPIAVAVDAAGNRRSVPIPVTIKSRSFAEKSINVDDDFLTRKVPALLQANGLADGGTLVDGYLRINRDLRVATERRVREICRQSTAQRQFQGALLRQPNAAPLSSFADRRTYLHDGQEIDRQTHLGFDLASLRASPVPSAAAGRVAFAGPLGIYGDTVIVDHGLGLFTLYGHLSAITVTEGATVAAGDVLGKTGETGLAAGDHLHFSVMIHGVHTDPVEWWDGHWIQDHVDRRLAAHPRAGSGS